MLAGQCLQESEVVSALAGVPVYGMHMYAQILREAVSTVACQNGMR